jgi:S1-C subfamily serine protease
MADTPQSGFDDLLLRAQRALAGATTVREGFQGVRAIIGPSKFPAGEDLAQAGMDALRGGEVPSPAQIAAIESVIKALRPSLLSQHALLEPLPTYQRYEDGVVPQWEAFRQKVKLSLYSVGRIDRIDGKSTDALATGFIVAPGVLATNTHVLDALSANERRLERKQAAVLFGQEFGVAPDPPAVAITAVLAVHPSLDMCLLEIEDSSRQAWEIEAKFQSKGSRIAAIGYPQDDPRSPVFRDVIFQNRYGVKRGAPGEVRGLGMNAVYHDCSTLGGNSGSPLVDLETGKVVGIHRDGPLFLFRNEAVDGPSLSSFVAGVVGQRK